MTYADYDFYVNVYHGDAVSPGDFLRLSERASAYVRSATRGLCDQVRDCLGRDAVQRAVCAVAEAMQDESRMSARNFSEEPAVSSETVGGWTKNFRASTVASNEVEYLDRKKREALELYLSGVPELSDLFSVRSCRCGHRR